MNTEMLTKSGELSDDELGRVTGGLDDDTATAAANILCADKALTREVASNFSLEPQSYRCGPWRQRAAAGHLPL